MKCIFIHIVVLCWLSSIHVNAQHREVANGSPLEKRLNPHSADTLLNKMNLLHKNIFMRRDISFSQFKSPLDSISDKIASLGKNLQQKLDSLKSNGYQSDSLQQDLQNILNSPQQKLESLLGFRERFKMDVSKGLSRLDTLQDLENILAEKADVVNKISTELRVGPLGKDLIPDVNSSVPDLSLPSGVVTDVDVNKDNPLLPQKPDLDLSAGIPGADLSSPLKQLTKRAEILTDKTSGLTDIAKNAADVAKKADEYKTDIGKVQEEGLLRSEKLDEVAESQALRIDELKAFKEQKAVEELEAYKKLIEQYKNEKRIEEEMKAKVKELANDVIVQNSGKVNDTMKKISRYKRKFSDVPDIRNLPRRAPNPLKGQSWRERVIPGIALQTLNNKKVWLELDPQVYYKLNGNWSAGIGGMYRFSMNPDKITFDDFGSMYGGKSFIQYNAFKAFFLRTEVQLVEWKPWRWTISDPRYIDKTYVGAIGLGKSYMVAKRVKGNAQTLYHWHWKGLDPYAPKIMIRLAFDFSLEKRKPRPWAEKLKALRKNK